MSSAPGITQLAASYVMRRETCECADSLEFIFLNYDLIQGFHYCGVNWQLVWMSILYFLANKVAFL